MVVASQEAKQAMRPSLRHVFRIIAGAVPPGFLTRSNNYHSAILVSFATQQRVRAEAARDRRNISLTRAFCFTAWQVETF